MHIKYTLLYITYIHCIHIHVHINACISTCTYNRYIIYVYIYNLMNINIYKDMKTQARKRIDMHMSILLQSMNEWMKQNVIILWWLMTQRG